MQPKFISPTRARDLLSSVGWGNVKRFAVKDFVTEQIQNML